mmetsp:Transcript_24984/g.34757  ORF Transcript_24984/g.34757 Transcript_24984/m.34757 type:complete len:120 (+) Transcript_24984:598-957(+)
MAARTNIVSPALQDAIHPFQYRIESAFESHTATFDGSRFSTWGDALFGPIWIRVLKDLRRAEFCMRRGKICDASDTTHKKHTVVRSLPHIRSRLEYSSESNIAVPMLQFETNRLPEPAK